MPNAVIAFTTTDKTGIFVPSSGTALTNANGMASVGLLPGSQTGAFTVTASASVAGAGETGSLNYTVVFPTLTLSALSINPATLSAGGSAGVSVSVSNGGALYTPALPVSFTSACVAAGKATIGSPVLTKNGVATASYVDKRLRCTRHDHRFRIAWRLYCDQLRNCHRAAGERRLD